MKHSQLTTLIDPWEGKSALYIVEHARYQSSRGKNPSEPYKGELNPRKALELALIELRTYRMRVGGWIPRGIAEMVAIAKITKQEVTGEFNGVSVTASPTSSPEALNKWWSNEMDRKAEEYLNSDEYKNSVREAREREELRQSMLQEALLLAPESITLKDEEGWKKILEANKDFIGVMNYAQRWARVMEGQMTNGRTLEECADETSHLADDEGMSGFSYGYAVEVLSHYWIHGEQLRRWHNSNYQLGNEGDEANESGAVLNPAVISIG